MSTIVKDRQVNFKVNSANYETAKQVFKEKGLDVSTAFNQFIQEVALTHDLPFKTQEEIEREILIQKLQKEVSTSYELLRKEKGLTVSEARKAVFE